MVQIRVTDEKQNKAAKPPAKDAPNKLADGGSSASLAGLQRQVGNAAVQRLLAQRSDVGPAQLDDETTQRINSQRGGGQTLDAGVQSSLGAAMGYDFSGVHIHTSPEANQLNRQLNAKAFTTGEDVFFQADAYQPHTSAGQELIAHELTHVVQQGTGQVGGGSGMVVNAPNDRFEQEANAVAKTAISPGVQAQVQRQAEDEEDETVQMQELDEDEELAE